MALRVRELTPEEAATVKRLAQSRTEPARLVERAPIIWRATQGQRVPAIAHSLDVAEATVRRWLTRFNAAGLEGLTDLPRSGRPATYPAEQVGAVLAAALAKPDDLGLPFGAWTLDRLVVYLQEQQGITMKRSRVGEVLAAEGLRWYTQETWFGERVDPAFAEKRGPSSSCAPRLRQAV